jgi:hypothetical protein
MRFQISAGNASRCKKLLRKGAASFIIKIMKRPLWAEREDISMRYYVAVNGNDANTGTIRFNYFHDIMSTARRIF